MPVLGIDTSCYTTSIAVVEGPRVLADRRILLKVPEGGRGLQQSKAFFQHINNLSELIDGLSPKERNGVEAVAVSTRPRPIEGSYMPVFTAGGSIARCVAAMLGKQLFETSHQEGHIAAGYHSLGLWPERPVLAFHISGGTTELLRATPVGCSFQIECIGGSQDLHAGQFVDRVGVALGLQFPAGPALERLAAQAGDRQERLAIKANVSGLNCSLSGAESAAQRLIRAGAEGPAVAYDTLRCLAEVFAQMANNAAAATGIHEILVIGGVASNGMIRDILRRTVKDAVVRFAVNPFSSDNAVGVAALGYKNLHRGEPNECTDS